MEAKQVRQILIKSTDVNVTSGTGSTKGMVIITIRKPNNYKTISLIFFSRISVVFNLAKFRTISAFLDADNFSSNIFGQHSHDEAKISALDDLYKLGRLS